MSSSKTQQKVTCPNCGEKFALDQVLTHEIEEELQKKSDQKYRRRERELKDGEETLKKAQANLKEGKKSLEKQVEERLEQERDKIEEKANKLELAMRKTLTNLKKKEEKLELEVTRKVDEEREKIEQDTAKRVEEDLHLEFRKRDKQLQGAKEEIEKLRRTLQQGSQQLQGEVFELAMEDALKAEFPSDLIEPVSTGIRGADIVQKVRNDAGHLCGAILWEAKQTKNWSNAWVEKLKDDQRQLKAEIAVLVSTALPKDLRNCGDYGGVWVTDYRSAMGLVAALRMGLLHTAATKLAQVGKNQKVEQLYNYFADREFKQRIEAIVEGTTAMKEELDRERRAMERIWARREKQIERVALSMAGMYGDMQGIIGASLPQIQMLELPASAADGDDKIES